MIVVLMGVAGSGKTTVGKLLAEKMEWSFYEGDDYHPKANRDKMAQGIPLTDEDRAPWLKKVRAVILGCALRHENAVITCSALKKAYRDRLTEGAPAQFAYLKGYYDLFFERIKQRTGHFVNPALLESQFRDLEEPTDAITVDASQDTFAIVDEIAAHLHN